MKRPLFVATVVLLYAGALVVASNDKTVRRSKSIRSGRAPAPDPNAAGNILAPRPAARRASNLAKASPSATAASPPPRPSSPKKFGTRRPSDQPSRPAPPADVGSAMDPPKATLKKRHPSRNQPPTVETGSTVAAGGPIGRPSSPGVMNNLVSKLYRNRRDSVVKESNTGPVPSRKTAVEGPNLEKGSAAMRQSFSHKANNETPVAIHHRPPSRASFSSSVSGTSVWSAANTVASPPSSVGASPSPSPKTPSRIPILASLDVVRTIQREAREADDAEQQEPKTRLPIRQTSTLRRKPSVLNGSPRLRARRTSATDVPDISGLGIMDLKPEPEPSAILVDSNPPAQPPTTVEKKSECRVPLWLDMTSLPSPIDDPSPEKESPGSQGSEVPLGQQSDIAKQPKQQQQPESGWTKRRRSSGASIPSTPSRLREFFVPDEEEAALSATVAAGASPRIGAQMREIENAPVVFLSLVREKIEFSHNYVVKIYDLVGDNSDADSYLKSCMEREINRALCKAVPEEVLTGANERTRLFLENVFYAEASIRLLEAGLANFSHFYAPRLEAAEAFFMPLLWAVRRTLGYAREIQRVQTSYAKTIGLRLLAPVELDLRFLEEERRFEQIDDMYKLALKSDSKTRYLYGRW